MSIDIITGVCLAGGIWSMLCRVNKMEWGVTRFAVIAASFAMLMALFSALILPATLAKASLSVGVLLYLLADSRRWGRGAPPETRHGGCDCDAPTAPQPVPSSSLRHVGGGCAEQRREP